MPGQSKSIGFLLFYLFLLYVRPQEFIPVLSGIPLLPVVLVLATVFWFKEPHRDMQSPQFKLMGWLYFLMCWSLLKGGLFEQAGEVLGGFFPPLLLFILIASGINTLSRMRMLFVVIGIVMTIISLHSIDEAANGIGWTGAVPLQGRVIYLGFLSDPNDLSMAMLMALPLMGYTAYKAGLIMRVFWLAAIGALMYAIALCDSRGAMLALACMLLHFCVLRFGVRRSMLVAPFMLAPLAFLGSSRMGDMSAKEESAEGRVRAWQQGFLMFYSNPLFGVGRGEFTSYHHITAHNSYMLVLAELGFVGFWVWISLLGLSVLMCAAMEFQTECDVPSPGVVDRPGGALVASLPPEDWNEVRLCARAVWLGFTGGLAAMFFLSRSYTTILYVHVAMVVAMWQMARRSNSRLSPITWATHAKKMFYTSVGGVIFLNLVTRKLGD